MYSSSSRNGRKSSEAEASFAADIIRVVIGPTYRDYASPSICCITQSFFFLCVQEEGTCFIDRLAGLVLSSDTRVCCLQMAEQDWGFAVLDDEDNNLNGGPWAGLNGFANTDDLGDHW
jgi:hypothetical protein